MCCNIISFLLFLVSPFFRITVVGKVFEGKTDLVEEWYGTEYSVNKIPAKYIEVLFSML